MGNIWAVSPDRKKRRSNVTYVKTAFDRKKARRMSKIRQGI